LGNARANRPPACCKVQNERAQIRALVAEPRAEAAAQEADEHEPRRLNARDATFF